MRVELRNVCFSYGKQPVLRDISFAAEAGELIAVLTTGAYNYSMASHYNRVPKPAVVMLRGGEAYLAVRRETPADLLAFDL